jgi:hypothetical protein
MQRSLKLPYVTVALALITGASALAHHGFTGRYDTDKPVFLVGRVTTLSTSPPHATITLTPTPSTIVPPSESERPKELTGAMIGPNNEYLGKPVTIEFPPVRAFFELGSKLKAGDAVEIIALRNCAPPHQLRSQWIRLPNREVVEREGRLSYMVRGCASQ